MTPTRCKPGQKYDVQVQERLAALPTVRRGCVDIEIPEQPNMRRLEKEILSANYISTTTQKLTGSLFPVYELNSYESIEGESLAVLPLFKLATPWENGRAVPELPEPEPDTAVPAPRNF